MSRKVFDRELFTDFPRETRVFYNRLIYMMALNDLAVQHGLFDVHLSDTDDVFSWFRFVEVMDDIEKTLEITDKLDGVHK